MSILANVDCIYDILPLEDMLLSFVGVWTLRRRLANRRCGCPIIGCVQRWDVYMRCFGLERSTGYAFGPCFGLTILVVLIGSGMEHGTVSGRLS